MTDNDVKAAIEGLQNTLIAGRALNCAGEMEREICDALYLLRSLAAENVQLREALEFYADCWNGHPGDSGLGGNYPADPVWEPDFDLIEDGGKRARAALKGESPDQSEAPADRSSPRPDGHK